MLVIITGPSRKPESSTQVVPVISPLPFRVNQPAKTESLKSVAAGKNGGHTGAHRTDTDLQRAAAGNQRGMADFDAFYVGDGIEGPWRAVKGNAQVPGARLSLGRCGRDQK